MVATWTTIPAIARDNQFIDGKVADDPANQMDQVQDTTASDKLIDDRFDVGVVPFCRRRMEDLGQQFAIFRREDPCRGVEAAARRQNPHDIEEVVERPDGVFLLFLRITKSLLKAVNDLGGIKDQG